MFITWTLPKHDKWKILLILFEKICEWHNLPLTQLHTSVSFWIRGKHTWTLYVPSLQTISSLIYFHCINLPCLWYRKCINRIQIKHISSKYNSMIYSVESCDFESRCRLRFAILLRINYFLLQFNYLYTDVCNWFSCRLCQLKPSG